MILWDEDVRGFAVRVGPRNTKYPKGKVSYFVQKRTGGRGSKEFRYVFGEYPQLEIPAARKKARSLIADVEANLNIAKQRRDIIELRRAEAENSRTKKFSHIFEEYRKHRSDGSYYWESDILYYNNKYFIPHFGNLAVTEISKGDIRNLLKSITHKSIAKKSEAQLRPFFKYCVREDIIKINPMADLAPLPKLKSRDRVLTKEELVAFWKATEDMKREGSLFGHVYQLLLVTGQRLREIAHMEREELNIPDQIFTLSANRSKNGLAHIVHLSPLALGIIASASRKSSQFVFSYNKNKLSGFSASKDILEQTMQKHLGKSLRPFQLRDLRRTFATGCAELGIDHNIADRILNHVSDAQSGVKGVYQRYEYLPERKQAMLTWNKYIEGLITPVELSVLPL